MPHAFRTISGGFRLFEYAFGKPVPCRPFLCDIPVVTGAYAAGPPLGPYTPVVVYDLIISGRSTNGQPTKKGNEETASLTAEMIRYAYSKRVRVFQPPWPIRRGTLSSRSLPQCGNAPLGHTFFVLCRPQLQFLHIPLSGPRSHRW